jgi:diacylglycerol kinase family enzyme
MTEAACALREYEAEESSLVVAAGGDGTINHLINALGERPLLLALLPLGTANDLARNLNVPLGLSEAAALINEGTSRRIDLIEVNGQRFCTVGGLGITSNSALMVGRLCARGRFAARAVRRLGPAIYRLTALFNILLRPRINQRIQISYRDLQMNDCNLEIDAHGLFIANQGSLGAGLSLSPRSNNQDGVFEICVLPRGSRAHLVRVLARMMTGAPLSFRDLLVIQTTRATITCQRDDHFFGDGELLCAGQEFNLSILHRALEVIC